MNIEKTNACLIMIGAGVVATACASNLSRSGRPVTILDQGRF